MRIEEYISKNREKYLSDLLELLKIPSVSADSAHSQDVFDCAEKVAELLENAGVEKVEVMDTKGYPVVYGEKIINKDLPTVLLYGHYDVQPPDPLELWQSAPFEPVIKKTDIHPDGAIFARGAADDKGQFMMHIAALEAMIKTDSLPCNIKFLIEGEEEIGSDSLEDFLIEHKEKLKNDLILISDTHIVGMDTPTLTVGLRGLAYMEVEVEGPNRDLHSGLYGGAVPNPINVLCDMIASLHDKDGKINIPGFYDQVIELTPEEQTELNKLPFNEKEWLQTVGLTETDDGEKGKTTLDKISVRPTLDVNGIWGGYIGQGAKTVIPSKAFAKISMRLVPNQNPDEISALFEKHFKTIAQKSVKITATPHHGGYPYVLESTHKGYQAAKKAMEKTFGKETLPFRGGGSIPIVALFEKILGSKSVLMGFGLDTDALHSPNEHYGLTNFYKGIETIPYFFEYYIKG